MKTIILGGYAAVRALRQEHGQDLIEYALIAALVSVLLVAALTGLRGGLEGAFGDITAALG